MNTRPVPPPRSDARLTWFRDAKFGLFIHWGLYALPAGEWKGRRAPGYLEHIMRMLRIPRQQYAQLAEWWNPHDFDPDGWVKLAQDAGMKYIVITAKHHDGFAMFRSAISPYNVYDATPFHRDPMKELAAACARRGMPLGFYYSQAQDWNEPGGLDNDWDFPSNDVKVRSGAFDQFLRDKSEPQVRELLQNYGPVCLLWFDTPHFMTDQRSREIEDLVHALQPQTLINSRLYRGDAGGDYRTTGDNEIPNLSDDRYFEVPGTVNQSWGYRRDDLNWKSAGEIIFHLMDIVSKGGNYLLDVGPDANGVIPRPARDVLTTVGRWVKRYGDAIYGAGRSPFGEEFGEYVVPVSDPVGPKTFMPRRDWRCTTKPGKLYITVFRAEGVGKTWDALVHLPAFTNRVRAAYMLDDPQRMPLPIQKNPDGTHTLTVNLDINLTMGAVAVVEIEGNAVNVRKQGFSRD